MFSGVCTFPVPWCVAVRCVIRLFGASRQIQLHFRPPLCGVVALSFFSHVNQNKEVLESEPFSLHSVYRLAG